MPAKKTRNRPDPPTPAPEPQSVPVPEAFPEDKSLPLEEPEGDFPWGEYSMGEEAPGGPSPEPGEAPAKEPGEEPAEGDRVKQEYADDGAEGGSKPTEPSQKDFADYGLSKEQAMKLDEEGRLVDTMNEMDHATIRQGQTSDVGLPQPVPPQQGVEPGQPGQGPPIGLGEYKLELDPEAYDSKFIEQMEALNAHHNQRFKRLEQAFVGQVEREEYSRQQQEVNNFDGWVGSLPDEYKETFGTGPITALEPTSMEVLKRQELYETCEALTSGFARMGRPIPPPPVIRERALRVVSGSDQRQQGRREGANQVSRMQRQLSNRPTARVSSGGSSEERAIKHAEEWKHARGD